MVIPREIEGACAKFWWLMSCIMVMASGECNFFFNLKFLSHSVESLETVVKFYALFFQVLSSLVAPPLETLQTVMLTDVVPPQEWNLKEARVQTLDLNL